MSHQYSKANRRGSKLSLEKIHTEKCMTKDQAIKRETERSVWPAAAEFPVSNTKQIQAEALLAAKNAGPLSARGSLIHSKKWPLNYLDR